MKGYWITGGCVLLCIGTLVFGNRHYLAEIEETRTAAYEQYTEDLTNESLLESKLDKERQAIDAGQQKKLKDANKIIKKVYDDTKHQSSELKGILQDLNPLVNQSEK